MERKKFKRDNYIHVPGYAVVDLQLSGNELLCYGLIHGFTQDGETEFSGSLSYIASALNVTKQNAKAIIDRLIKKNLIIKREIITNKVKLCRYYINNYPVIESATQPVTETATPPVIESATNNNIHTTIDTEPPIIIPPQKDLFGETPSGIPKGTREGLCLFENSIFHDFAIFEKEFDKPEFAGVDIYYYYQAISDWSASGGKKKHDWIATARNWMRSDMQKNQLHRIKSNEVDPDMIEYLHSMQQ